ncbi:MAG TPA: molybdopterin cofactor-binding domain-containing protein, partial [Acidimicrobiales bacterium]|nr:molybdopterin cofactor-binding domain-containing protein [Acidimicrobiales bacterium]
AKGVVTTTAPIGAFRGAGRPEATFTIEQAMDRVAWELGLDPAEVRRKNLIGPDEFPFVTATGMTYDSGRYEVCLDALLEALDYETLRKEQARRREEGGPLLGIGISTYVEITGALGFGEDGSVEILDDGRVRVVTGTSPHGQGHRTAWAQLVADSLGLDSIDGIEVLHGDTKVAPNGAGTFGSRSLQFGGSAVRLAAVAMADKLRELAAHALEASPDDIELSGGGAHVRGTPSIALSLADLKAVAADPARRPDGFDADGNGNGDGDGRLTTHHFFEQEGWTFPCGAHGVVVEIDTDTGSVKIKRVVAVDDCGTVLNPMIVEGQVHGGLTQGLAQALWEGVSYSPEGQPLTTNFADYTVPSACEVPFYETISIQTPSPLNPLGAKGVGESGTIGSTPAAVSAVLDGLRPLGITNIDMPLTPEKVWKAVQEVAR